MTVYVRAVTFVTSDLDGRVALLAQAVGHRYLVIEIACGRSRLAQMSTLGHELHHALEIAEEPSVVDARTLAAFYERIGRKTSDWGGRLTFETDAAANAGLRARRNYSSTAQGEAMELDLSSSTASAKNSGDARAAAHAGAGPAAVGTPKQDDLPPGDRVARSRPRSCAGRASGAVTRAEG